LFPLFAIHVVVIAVEIWISHRGMPSNELIAYGNIDLRHDWSGLDVRHRLQ
jgi:hypothetical protein